MMSGSAPMVSLMRCFSASSLAASSAILAQTVVQKYDENQYIALADKIRQVPANKVLLSATAGLGAETAESAATGSACCPPDKVQEVTQASACCPPAVTEKTAKSCC